MERTTETAARMEPKWIRRNSIIVASMFVFAAIIGSFSVAWPSEFKSVSEKICSNLPLGCQSNDNFHDIEMLSALGYNNYAIGFESLRRIGVILSATSAVIFASIVTISRGYRFTNDIGVVRIFATVAFMYLLGNWIFFQGDFYYAADGDFSGVLRPPIGSVVFCLGVVFFGIGVPSVFFMIGKIVNSTFRKNL